MRLSLRVLSFASLALTVAGAACAETPHIFQHPALSRTTIAFGYADDLWTVPREGGRATRLTTGVGIESAPIFSPDGNTIAFTADYDGNTDVYTVPATGGVPHRVTYHPAPDVAVAWTPDGKSIVFRSTRDAYSRYTRLFTVAAAGGVAKPLPLPMAYAGELSADGGRIAYSPLPPAFGFDYTSYVSWGNYHGGRAGTINLTTLPGLDTVQVPHEAASDFSPTWLGDKVYFLSGRKGPITVFSYDPATKEVTELVKPASSETQAVRSLASGPGGLVYDQLGAIYLFDPVTGSAHRVPITVEGDLPEVRPRIQSVAGEVENIGISPTGLRVVVEAHGEILTVPAKDGPTRNLTNTPGAMEREPAWSPDGQSIAFFSNENSELYRLRIVPQTGAQIGAQTSSAKARDFALAGDAAFYFSPMWSPDSKRIAFHDNHNRLFVIDVTTGKLTTVDDANVFGGFSSSSFNVAWSPDSKWLAYPHSTANHLHILRLYSVDSGQSAPFTSQMADSRNPAFDRDGKYLYFTASTNFGATSDGLDMTSDLYDVKENVYAVVLASDQPSPTAPKLDDEKTPDAVADKDKDNPKDEDTKGGDEAAKSGSEDEKKPKAAKPVKPTRIDLAGIESRTVAMPLPMAVYTALESGKPGTLYFLTVVASSRFSDRDAGTLSRYVLETRKTEKLAERVASFQLSADGTKMLLKMGAPERDPGAPPMGEGERPHYVIVSASAPVKAGEGAVSFAALEVRVDPTLEWQEMFHEVWRIERAYFYDANFHGVNTAEEEKRLTPYAAGLTSRADLNYLLQEMLTPFSVGHLRGTGGNIPQAKHVAGGLLGADYTVRDGHYCFTKIYTGGDFNPTEKAPLAQPGLNVQVGDCIVAINGEPVSADHSLQEPLEGTAGRDVSLRIQSAAGTNPREITVVPVANEYGLRNTDWIDSNRKKVDELSGGKLAYVYLPDTAEGGFTNFNRYYFAQLDKKGAVIDERFNGGGQIADYIIEVMKRQVESFWAPRYGAIEHTPNAAIYGPKVMIVNEFAGSGGDAMPWLFRYNHIGPLVGKRTWGGLVGIGQIPVLMDGGHVTSPSVAFFSPKGEWDVENHGVDPDVVVDQDPKAVAAGHDPQLEKAVAVALEELAKHPFVQPQRPAYPNYHKQ